MNIDAVSSPPIVRVSPPKQTINDQQDGPRKKACVEDKAERTEEVALPCIASSSSQSQSSAPTPAQKNLKRSLNEESDSPKRQVTIPKFIQNIYDENKVSKAAAAPFVAEICENLAPKCFIPELIQNAHDRPPTGVKSKITFRYIEGAENHYVVFQHNGKHFEPQDIRDISDYRRNTENKVNPDTVGEKDLGFKSVFMAADCVWVVSQETKFHFSKEGHEKPLDYPYWWIFFPRVTQENEFPNEVKEYCNSQEVTFILKLEITCQQAVKKALDDWMSQLDSNPFLPNIGSVHYFHNQTLMQDVSFALSSDRMQIHSATENRKTEWLIHWTTRPIPPSLKEKMGATDRGKVLFKKNLQMSHVNIAFAARMDTGGITPTKGFFYTLLPTRESEELLFHVNSSFKLETSRLTFQSSNLWNDFIFQSLPDLWLQWLASLAKDDRYCGQMLRLFQIPKSEVLKQELKKALRTIPFLLSVKGELILLQGSQVDPFDFFDHFADLFPENVTAKIISSKVRAKEYLPIEALGTSLEVKVETLTVEKIAKEVAKLCLELDDPIPFQQRLLKFLATTEHRPLTEHSPLVEELRGTECLLSSDKKHFCNPFSVFLSGEPPVIPKELMTKYSYNFIHPQLRDAVGSEWLRTFTAGEASHKNYIHQILVRFNSSVTNPNENKAIIRYLFSRFKEGDIDSADLSSEKFWHLRDLKVICQKGISKPLTAVCLPSQYRTVTRLEEIYSEDFMVSTEWIEGADDETIDLWRQFFVALGAKETLLFTQREVPFIMRELLVECSKAHQHFRDAKQKNFNSYFKHLKDEKPSDKFENFIDFDCIEFLTDEKRNRHVAPHFWGAAIKKWEENNSFFDSVKRNGEKVKSYPVFFLENEECIRCADGKLRKLNGSLCSPFLRELLKGNPCPDLFVADLPLLSQKMAESLKMRSILTVFQIMQIFKYAQEKLKHPASTDRIGHLFHYILNNYRLIRERESLKAQMFSLPDNQGKPRPKKDIYFADIPGGVVPLSAGKYPLYDLTSTRSVELQKSNVKTVCQWLGVQVIEEKDLQITGAFQEDTKHSLLIDLKKKSLPIILLYAAEGYIDDTEAIKSLFNEFFKKVNQLKFMTTTSEREIRLKAKEIEFRVQEAFYFDLQNGTIYGTGRLIGNEKFYDVLFSKYFEIKNIDNKTLRNLLKTDVGSSWLEQHLRADSDKRVYLELFNEFATQPEKFLGPVQTLNAVASAPPTPQKQVISSSSSTPLASPAPPPNDSERKRLSSAKKTIQFKKNISEINLNEVHLSSLQLLNKATSSSSSSSLLIVVPRPKQEKTMTDEEKSRVGMEGEFLWYRKLQVEKQAKDIRNLNNGCEWTVDGRVRRITWHNKASYERQKYDSTTHHYDLSYKEDGQAQIYYEVKTTTAKTARVAELSYGECVFMHKHEENWHLVRVYNILCKNGPPSIMTTTGKDLLEQIKEKQVRFSMGIYV